MLKQAVNEIEIQVLLEGRGHLMVKDGRYNPDVKKSWGGGDDWPAMIFISRNPLERTVDSVQSILRAGEESYGQFDFFLPGSSVRGAWRSHLEKALRSLGGATVCDPLIEHGSGNSCSRRLQPEEGPPSEHPYRESCPVCKLFGDTAHGSRIAIGDGEPRSPVKAVLVDNVAIRRQTGSVAAPFRSLALRNAKFELTVRIRNYELWQAGLIGHLFDDLAAGRVALGSGKNKGWGVVKATATRILISHFGLRDPLKDGNLPGLAELASGQASKYGFIAADGAPEVASEAVEEASSPWRHTRKATDAAAFWNAVKPCFDENVWNRLAQMERERVGAHG